MSDKASTELQKKQETPLRQGVEPTRAGRLFMPPTDILETNDSIVVMADMPGVGPGGVEITLENSVLTVRGTCSDAHRQDANVAYVEYDVGNYERAFAMSNEIDREKIEARMANGVLTLTLAKARPSRKRIEVRTG